MSGQDIGFFDNGGNCLDIVIENGDLKADDGFETVEVELPAPVIEETAAADIIAEPAIAEASPQSTAVSLVEGHVRLTMSFSGDCWTEISDASGTLLYRDLGRDGRTTNVTGEAPLSVLFGNAVNVSVRVNGSDYAISAADMRGELARLTILSP